MPWEVSSVQAIVWQPTNKAKLQPIFKSWPLASRGLHRAVKVKGRNPKPFEFRNHECPVASRRPVREEERIQDPHRLEGPRGEWDTVKGAGQCKLSHNELPVRALLDG